MTFSLPHLPYDLHDEFEQGGLLFGTPGGQVELLTGTLPGDERGRDYWLPVDPGHLEVAERAAELGLVQLGWWHSHPAGTPQTPSEVDAEQFREALEQLGARQLWFPIVTGGIVKVFTLTPEAEIKEVAWTSRP